MSTFQMYSLMYSRYFARTNKTGIERAFGTRDSKRRTFESEDKRERERIKERIGEREKFREWKYQMTGNYVTKLT